MRFDIYKNGNKINTIISDEEFCMEYCQTHRYSYKAIEEDLPTPKEDYTQPADNTITHNDDVDSMLIDHEYRLTLLELGVNE
jgi:hypothetical protein